MAQLCCAVRAERRSYVYFSVWKTFPISSSGNTHRPPAGGKTRRIQITFPRSVLNLHLCGALIDIKIRPCDTDHHPLSKGTTFLFSLSQTNYILKDFPTLSDMSLFWIRSELKVAPFKTMWAGWSSCQTTSTAVLINKTSREREPALASQIWSWGQ